MSARKASATIPTMRDPDPRLRLPTPGAVASVRLVEHPLGPDGPLDPGVSLPAHGE